ncbi:MAG: sugar transferase [Candidatus Spechtbacteria bacterium]|nr:sugar transferase [Candidatus Spechtbacteria bacterium]
MSEPLKLKKLILLAGDIGMLLLSLPLTLLIAFQGRFNRQILMDHLLPFLFIYGFLLVLFYVNNMYDMKAFKSTTSLAASIVIIHGLGVLAGIVFFYLLTDPAITPKTNLALNMVAASFLIWGWRAFFQRFLTSHLSVRVAIAGMNEHAKELADIITKRPYMGYKLVACIPSEPLFGHTFEGDVKTIFTDKHLVENLKKENIGTIIMTENPHLNPVIAQAFYECIPHRIQFLDLAQSYELLTGRIPISYINQTWFLENINEKTKQLYDSVKRVFDIFASISILCASLPLWPFIAFFIKWGSAGPVFYSQERVGANQKRFQLLKFRSMIHNAERGVPLWAKINDPRVTRIGKLLRRTHLDELPQMINVFKGEISFVGPRPERKEFVDVLEKQIPHYNIRHIIKPGFTGWAQVNFRYARTPMDTYEKFQYDLFYLKNRSLILDLSIILKTLRLFLKNE